MRRTLLLLPIIALLSQLSIAQTSVDTIYHLQDIEIYGHRSGGLNRGEIKRLQVEDNLSSSTNTVAEAFRQLPSLITDIEGGVTFRGANKPGMLINGVPYGLLEEYSGDVLIQLPALFFNRISMSSFPPAGMVPDGDAGLLNLSSALYTRGDSPLQVTLGGGLQERYNAGAVVNLHPGRFHIVGKYNYRKELRERSFSKTTTTATGTTEMNNNASARPDVHLADLSVGYDLTDRDVVSVYGLYYLMEYSRYGGINNTVRTPDGKIKNQMLRHRYNDQQNEAYAAEASWKHVFSTPADYLDVTFNYNNFAYDEDNDYKNEKPGTGTILAEDNLFIHQKKNNYFISAAYHTLFAGGWYLDAGYIGRIKSETYQADAADKKEGAWIPNTGKSDDFSFHRTLHLLYASVAKSWEGFSAEAGLQAEGSWQRMESDRIADLATGQMASKENTRYHLYPHARFSLNTHEGGKISLSYTQRTIRPYGADLNPFVNTSDATHVWQGNPDLKNELIHSVELAYQLSFPTVRISPALYYRNKANRIMDVLASETVWKKENIGHSQALGFELSGNWNPIRILNIGLSADIYRDEIDGRNIGFGAKKSLVCGDVKGSIQVRITPTTEFQADGFYISDQLTPQGKIESRYSVNAGLSQYFMHRKLRANLSINNIFDSLGETTLVDTKELQITQVRNRDARVTWLTLTYQL